MPLIALMAILFGAYLAELSIPRPSQDNAPQEKTDIENLEVVLRDYFAAQHPPRF